MFKFIGTIILVGIGIGILAVYTVPTYKKIQALKIDEARYAQALGDAKELLTVKQELSDKYSSIDQKTQIERINKLLPDNVDNIRLILELSKVGEKYGMTIKNVKFEAINQATKTTADQKNVDPLAENKTYGTFSFAFSTTGTYPNFVNFMTDMEKSLRIVDVDSIEFSTVDSLEGAAIGVVPGRPKDVNNYDFKINTYWLKN